MQALCSTAGGLSGRSVIRDFFSTKRVPSFRCFRLLRKQSLHTAEPSHCRFERCWLPSFSHSDCWEPCLSLSGFVFQCVIECCPWVSWFPASVRSCLAVGLVCGFWCFFCPVPAVYVGVSGVLFRMRALYISVLISPTGFVSGLVYVTTMLYFAHLS
jgi:hypothetical protein